MGPAYLSVSAMQSSDRYMPNGATGMLSLTRLPKMHRSWGLTGTISALTDIVKDIVAFPERL